MMFHLSSLGERPDYRLIISFLWGDFHNVDTAGNADSPASRSWTSLYCRDRTDPHDMFEIDLVRSEPMTLSVASDNQAVAARVALFLHLETNCCVLRDDKEMSAQELTEICGRDFDASAAVGRAAQSVWRSSSLENPYPNMEG